LPDAALSRLLAEFFTCATAGTTAEAAVTGGWPFADLIALSRLESEFCSAVVCDGYADFASLAKVFALVWTLFSAVCWCRSVAPVAARQRQVHIQPGDLS